MPLRHSPRPRAGRRARPRLAAVLAAAALCTVLAIAPAAQARPPKSGGGTTATGTAMTVQWETIQRPDSSQDPAYFEIDDFMNWEVTGQIAPGDSYTFTPQWPTSSASEVPAASAYLSWSGSTTLTMSTVVPQNNVISGVDPTVNHIGQQVTAPVYLDTAELCLFMTGDSSTPSWNYTITVTNTGTQTATGVLFSGQESNGYIANYSHFCNRADADADGWNDTLEQSMLDLTYPAATDNASRFGVLGSDYLGAVARTATANDEVDSDPADVNDDGVVNATDVAIVQSYVGQGTGVPVDRVDYTGSGPNTYNTQAGLWRRYDLDGDGLVTANDVAWVQDEVGRPVPDPQDVIPPHVVIDSSYVPASLPRGTGVWLGASARDNRMLASVRFTVNGTAVTQQCTTPMNEAADPTALGHPTAGPEYSCYWAGSKRAGQYTVEATATDAAGNTSTDTMVLTVT